MLNRIALLFCIRIKSQQLYHGAEEFLIDYVGFSETLMSYSGDAARWSIVPVEILSLLRNHLGYKLYTSIDICHSRARHGRHLDLAEDESFLGLEGPTNTICATGGWNMTQS